MVKIVKIDKWASDGRHLFGFVTGHPKIPDGTFVKTSVVMYIRPDLNVAVTLNTVYELERAAPKDEDA